MASFHKSEIKGWLIFLFVLPTVLLVLGIWGACLFVFDGIKKLLIKAGILKPKYPYPFW